MIICEQVCVCVCASRHALRARYMAIPGADNQVVSEHIFDYSVCTLSCWFGRERESPSSQLHGGTGLENRAKKVYWRAARALINKPSLWIAIA